MWWKILHKSRRTRRLDWRQLSNVSISNAKRTDEAPGDGWKENIDYRLHFMRPQRLKGQVCRCCKCFQKKTTDSLFFDLWFGACLIPTCKQLLQSFVLPSCLWPWTGLDCHQDWHGPWLGWCWYRLGGERKGSKMKDRKTCPFPISTLAFLDEAEW